MKQGGANKRDGGKIERHARKEKKKRQKPRRIDRWRRREGREGSTVMWNQMLLISCVTVRAPAIATVSHSTSKQRECFINRKSRWHIYKHTVAGGERAAFKRYSLPQQVLFLQVHL